VGVLSARNARVSWVDGIEPTRSRWIRRKNSASEAGGDRGIFADAAACWMGVSMRDGRGFSAGAALQKNATARPMVPVKNRIACRISCYGAEGVPEGFRCSVPLWHGFREWWGMSTNQAVLRGVFPVFQTPWDAEEAVDYEILEREIGWLFDEGADGVVMAMVSETLRMSSDERDAVATQVCRMASGRGAAVISVGAESSVLAEWHAVHAEEAGADAVMAIPPVSVALGEEELLRYYRRIIEAVNIPVIVQDASGYVGRPMSVSMQARLLDEFGAERVQYKPEASPIGPRLSALRDATGGLARVFEGTGGIALVDSYRRGVVGTMPGADLIRGLVALWRALESGDAGRADAIHGPLSALVSLQTSLDAFLAVEKHLLVRQGIFRDARVRGPVGYVLDEETRVEVDRLFDRMIAVVEGGR
jgi:dihydrodipicolinate synthase/N-acetylneuraminate lyase